MGLVEGSKRGQIGIEAVAVIAAALLLFGIVSALAIHSNAKAKTVSGIWEKEAECLKISIAISQVYSSGNGMSALLETDKNVFLKGKTVYLNDAGKRVEEGVFCAHSADLNAEYGFTGKVRAENEDGRVAVKGA